MQKYAYEQMKKHHIHRHIEKKFICSRAKLCHKLQARVICTRCFCIIESVIFFSSFILFCLLDQTTRIFFNNLYCVCEWRKKSMIPFDKILNLKRQKIFIFFETFFFITWIFLLTLIAQLWAAHTITVWVFYSFTHAKKKNSFFLPRFAIFFLFL